MVHIICESETFGQGKWYIFKKMSETITMEKREMNPQSSFTIIWIRNKKQIFMNSFGRPIQIAALNFCTYITHFKGN